MGCVIRFTKKIDLFVTFMLQEKKSIIELLIEMQPSWTVVGQ